MMPRHAREAILRELIAESSFHHILHALLEICHENTHRAMNSQYPAFTADRWQSVCEALTETERRAAFLGL